MLITFQNIPSSLLCSRSSAPIDGPQVPPLKRTDLEPGALGTKGNLQFTEQEGGTAPAPRAGVPSPETSPSFAERRADLEACVIGEGTEPRAQRETLVQARAEVRANSRLIGNVLGSLTAKVDGVGHFINPDDCSAIAQALNELNVPPSEVGLYSLKGAKYCLDTYMDELKELDVVALRYGALSNESSCEAVLDMISPRDDDAARIQASRVLGEIAEAVDRWVLRRTVHEPLSKVANLLDAHPVDAHKLFGQLVKVSNHHDTLMQYFDSLSLDELKSLRSVVLADHSSRVLQAMSRITTLSQNEFLIIEDALAVLRQAELAFEFACAERAIEIIGRDMLGDMNDAVGNGRLSDVCALLLQLSVRVSTALAIFERLPNYASVIVERFTTLAMDVLRDQQNNPVGPLNLHSLRQLDGRMRANLSAAAVVLCAFGLELEPELRVC